MDQMQTREIRPTKRQGREMLIQRMLMTGIRAAYKAHWYFFGKRGLSLPPCIRIG